MSAFSDTVAAQAAIDAHKEAMQLEADQPAGVDLWHLLVSLLAWSDEKGVDFDSTLCAVRAELRVVGRPS